MRKDGIRSPEKRNLIKGFDEESIWKNLITTHDGKWRKRKKKSCEEKNEVIRKPLI